MGLRQTSIKKQLADPNTLIKDIESMDQDFTENHKSSNLNKSEIANSLEKIHKEFKDFEDKVE